MNPARNATAAPAPAAPKLAWACLALLAAFTLLLTIRLWPEWTRNPDLSHALFMPVIFIFLLWESRRAGPARYHGGGPVLTALLGAALAAGLAALVTAGLLAAALGWTSAIVEFCLTAALAGLWGGGLLVFSERKIRLLPLNWIALAAIGLWLLCSPLPPGTYSTLTLRLQTGVTAAVLHSLHLLGIAAARQGNVIHLAHTSVGIEEACSGIRSLISCVFAGLFFSAALVRRPWGRALIIALAAPLAIGMNFLRSLLLTLLANAGVEVAGFWHDATGYAILAVTAVILGLLAWSLAPAGELPADRADPPEGAGRARFAPRLLALGLGLAAVLTAVFVVNTRAAPPDSAPAPDLAALLPPAANGWQVVTDHDLYRFAQTLQTDRLIQRTYRRNGPGGPVQFTIYLAYWSAGQASVSLVASHTPDACWPGTGWIAEPVPQPRVRLALGNGRLPETEYRSFQQDGDFQRVWFWHLYAGRPIAQENPRSVGELLRLAWRYGFRPGGSQVFIRVSSGQPWEKLAGEPLVREIFANLHSLGL